MVLYSVLLSVISYFSLVFLFGLFLAFSAVLLFNSSLCSFCVFGFEMGFMFELFIV